jgi:uncharacterized short protein YbdD (DUF466 family)
MDTSQHDHTGTAAAGACCCSVASDRRMKTAMRRLGEVCHRIFGFSDYERYAVHSGEHHEGEAATSRRHFFVRSNDRKHGGRGCC